VDAYTERLRRLRARLAGFDGLAVAFSAGVDSSVLLHAAHAALGERAVGVIADSPSLPRRELADGRAFATAIGARLHVIPTDELAVAGYRANAGQRCYWCRRTLFELVRAWAAEQGFAALAYGEITDDLLDDRPGRRAAHELGVVAPLREVGFSKRDVRRYAREHGLAPADKPASACLASRLPIGTEVTAERLRRIERAEERVRSLGFRVLRVRDLGRRARVEVGADELGRARRARAELERVLSGVDFDEVELAAYGAAAGAVLNADRSAGRLPGSPAPGS